ncbi:MULTISPECIES: spore germination protein GerPE [unclassified Cytobacillus]|uniref:spore germination protein GerPE n=1 Tax=unclassified Cytobacillus TaxID=2675268 RepID=UPI00135C804B|nr:spore germination protein GerPE [Cytobacillus sp. AMY 15.2]KAF0818049.1 Protein GerPE, required for proper assembly of spore coat, mutations lead to super-dormant spore [Bacillus sp. ZZV12-4809]MCM3092371.1 spore germination protein GerPE [Cytobacillus sp. AMY 15.2]
MLQRTSSVDRINIDTIAFSSVFEIGDSCFIKGYSRAIADQREVEYFNAKEGNFSVYPVFREPIHLIPIDEDIAIQTTQLNPIIRVQNININGVSSSSVIHIGNSGNISMEARVKHIRQITSKNSTSQSELEDENFS